jgi:hypothetical protein
MDRAWEMLRYGFQGMELERDNLGSGSPVVAKVPNWG